MAESQGQQPARTETVQDLTGTMVGRFAVQARLGSGGMGEVYRAEDTKLKRSVALKRIAPRLSTDERFRRRFMKEAERASRLSDQHIASVYDVLEKDREIFLVMEYVDGHTLRQRLAQPLGIRQFLEVAVQCAQALAAAHERGVVHCDIKPENIMLIPRPERDQVKILDFGVAKELPHAGKSGVTASTASQSAMLSGTPAYMAPEVLLEENADGRADIFSLGVVFYEALTGRHPFLAETFMGTCDRILHEAPPSPEKINPPVPPEVARIVTRMLAKDPAARYATAHDLLAELIDAQRAVVEHAELPSHQAERPSRIKRPRALLLAGVILAALIGAATRVPSLRSKLEEWLGVATLPQKKHLAVLPFLVVGADPQAAAFGDGLTETLSAKLTQLAPGNFLQVVPAGEVRVQRVRSAEQARQEFGVNLVLEGSWHRSGDMVRIAFALVDASTRRQLRAATITAEASDPFATEDRVVQGVAQMLELEMKPEARGVLASHRSRVAGAEEFYLEGRGYLQNYEKPENIESAISVFNQSLKLDPNYALAYAGLGEAYWRKFESTKDSQWVANARQACERAASMDATIAAAHICLGTLENGTGQNEQAAAEFRRALETEPTSDAAFRGLASAYENMNKLAEAERTHLRAIEARPSYWVGYRELARFYFRRGRYNDAVKQLLKAADLAPDNPYIYYSLGAYYHMMGKEEEAIRILKKSLALRPTSSAYTNLGTIYHFQGRYREAVPMMEKAVDLGGGDFQLWGNLGETYQRVPELAAKAPEAYGQAARLAGQQLIINPKDAETRAWLAVYRVKLGDKDPALAEIERARRLAPGNVDVLFRAAQVYELAGRRDPALDALKLAVARGYSIAEVRTAADLASLRNDPRYKQMFAW